MSLTLETANFEYMLRKPWVKRPRERAPVVFSAIICRKTSLIPRSAIAFSRWASSRKMKCREKTPDCGTTVEVLAVALIAKSMSPARLGHLRLLAEGGARELPDLGIEDLHVRLRPAPRHRLQQPGRLLREEAPRAV